MASQAREAGDVDRDQSSRAARVEILETVEAGLVLRGTESSRSGPGWSTSRKLRVRPERGRLAPRLPYQPLQHGTDANHDLRGRKLLFIRGRSIASVARSGEKGLTSFPCGFISRMAGQDELGLRARSSTTRRHLREREVRREWTRRPRAERGG